ncbi:hypothetical protein GPK34_06975 [Secundilactobacillus kimchicus]|uniref:hypothetical protein n=1 Tax=Secundilactobacillus kimchicus TaxID=528209 RepID=UPI001C035344|nr:hypothetical protein [Secundilactobacillus kimchicus]MBT9671772.1 hypothetical protein [Secundilactobacillus kimchicus]
MKKSVLATLALSAGLVGGLISTQSASAKTTYVSAMPKAFRHTWYRGNQALRFTAHTWANGVKGQKFAYVAKFKKVIRFKIKGGYEYIPAVNADVPAFVVKHNHLYAKNQQDGWDRYHR